MMMRAAGRRVLGGAGRARAAAAAQLQARAIHASLPSRKEEEPLGPSMVEKFQLNDPTRYVPLTIAGFSISSLTGLYHFDAESQLLALWVLFCGTVYSRGGPIIAEMLDEMSDAVLKEHKAAEEAEIEAVRVTMEAHQRQTAVFKDIQELFDAQKSVMDKLVETSDARLAHGVRDTFIKKLNTLVSLDSKTSETSRKILIEKATESVKNAYLASKDASLKNKALDAALAALSSPESAKKDDTVGQLYTQYFAQFGKKMKDASAKPVELTPQAAAEISEAVANVARRDGLEEGIVKGL